MTEDSITEREIGDWLDKIHKEPDEPELDSDRVQLKIDQSSYGEQSITDDSGSVNKNCDDEVTKIREILEQKERMVKERSDEPDQTHR